MEIFIITFILQLFTLLPYSESISNNTIEQQKSDKLPPCAACRVLTDSFRQGMDRTARGKFEGGDTAWEEEKMGSYRISEVRLIEVQEKLCSEVVRGQNQCHANSEQHESLIEEWWFHQQDTSPDLYQWLCIQMLEVCCPFNHFGPKCLPCKGGAINPCGGNGRCKGNNTRKGNGECECNSGYSGELCTECSPGYYLSYEDENKVLCNACHKSCQGTCTDAGPKACLACNAGWTLITGQGCRDINECVRSSPCGHNEFCLNTDGSYKCIKCTRSCDGCTGDGPDMCIKCAQDFEMEDGICVDTSGRKREEHMLFARYVTYAGLTIATCIILQKNPTIAAVIGLFVAVYITFSEYYLNLSPNDGNKSKSTQYPSDQWAESSMGK